MKKPARQNKRRYLISLYHTRSVLALDASILVFCITAFSIGYELRQFDTWNTNMFCFFTILSNMFAAIGAMLMMPYAVAGIRKKRFELPGWIVMVQYSGAVCVAVTMMTTLLLLIPVEGEAAVAGTNLYLHLITPPLTIILFASVESCYKLPRWCIPVALVPYWLYMIVYYINVIVIGEENGGWKDIYHIAEFWPAWISVVGMFIAGLVIAWALLWGHNRLTDISVKRLTDMWTDDLGEADLLVEAFGLGRYMGKHCDAAGLTMPLDIFYMMHDRYGIPVESLARAFYKGALDSIEERKAKHDI